MSDFGRELLACAVEGTNPDEKPLRHVADLPPRQARPQAWPHWAHPDVVRALIDRGISAPWSHQFDAADLAHDGRHVVLSTGTASGKSLAYQLPILTAFAGLLLVRLLLQWHQHWWRCPRAHVCRRSRLCYQAPIVHPVPNRHCLVLQALQHQPWQSDRHQALSPLLMPKSAGRSGRRTWLRPGGWQSAVVAGLPGQQHVQQLRQPRRRPGGRVAVHRFRHWQHVAPLRHGVRRMAAVREPG